MNLKFVMGNKADFKCREGNRCPQARPEGKNRENSVERREIMPPIKNSLI